VPAGAIIRDLFLPASLAFSRSESLEVTGKRGKRERKEGVWGRKEKYPREFPMPLLRMISFSPSPFLFLFVFGGKA